ncbi:DNA internalization-related competence protein ComEC/Rec2 [Radiobacillus kanasensis]|uniref:DNA internalization-related competence protein ComEC/Rec2 n=1 Tax=Radiobacillus kanasensis TaxID=2844358 RepID=UPI001E32AF5F|nr:DNA internalization-related competence protein ComEC/Rec2 [Radiobacillus kanasensis]UFT97836.1 DNA internalization-related competence protein ComEC/Rec2 [Radiobacillus kanasensis]
MKNGVVLIKGYWHWLAFAALIAALTATFDTYSLLGIFLLWLAWVHYKHSHLRAFLVLLLLFTFVLFFWFDSTPKSSPPQTSTSSTFQGKIVSIEARKADRYTFVIEEENKQKTMITIFPENREDLRKNLSTIKYGAICRMEGKKEIPDGSRNPGQFDYRKYLEQDGIYFQVTNPVSFKCMGSSHLEYLYSVKEKWIGYIERYDSFTSAWLQALLLGDDSALPDETIELFRRWGLSHLLAISGLHVGLLIGMVYLALIKIGQVTKEKAQLGILFLLPFYAFLAGGEPSIWRASSMVILAIMLQRFHVKYPVSDIISVVFIFLLLTDATMIRNIGFQFSFLVTFSILLSKKWLESTSSLLVVLRISLIAQLCVLPLQAFHFYSFNPLSVLINVMVVPYFSFIVMPFVVVLFLLVILLPWVGILLQHLFTGLHQTVIQCLYAIDEFAYIPWVTGKLSLPFIFLLFICFIFMMQAQLRKSHNRAFLCGCIFVLLLVIHSMLPYLNPKGTLTMLDIGQGDCFVLELPYRQGVIIIDAAGKRTITNEVTDQTFTQVIRPFLQAKGIRTIDAIIISHNDLDHVGSVPFLLQHFNVKSIWTSPFFELEPALKNGLQKQKIQVKSVEKGEVFYIQGQSFYTFHPDKDLGEKNRNSLVLFFELGGLDWLFTGDIGVEEEKKITTDYSDLHVDILKVAHHGSKTSTSEQLLQRTKPKMALISVGQDNRYGHPNQDVIQRLKKYDVSIMRTDLNGAIMYEFKKEEGTFFKYIP